MKKTITIEKPCTASWSEMETTSPNCRFCQSCQKEVIDFTQKSDAEIARTLKSGGEICGRFKSSQLDRSYTIPQNTPRITKLAWASMFSGLLFAQSAVAENPPSSEGLMPNTEQVPTSPKSVEKQKVEADSTKIRTITGVVMDEDGEVLPGATITIKGTEQGCVADIDGKYSIEITKDDSVVLVFNFVGFDVEERKITNDISILNITLVSNYVLGGEIVVAGGVSASPKPLTPRWFWWKIKRFPRWVTSPFRKKHKH